LTFQWFHLFTGLQVNNVWQEQRWLPVRKCITYKLCVLMFDVYHGTAPEYLTNLCSRCDNQRLRSPVRGDFVVRRTRTRLANSSFTVAGPAAWNLLPVSIRNTNSHSACCRQLKTYLFCTPDWLPYLCSLHCVNSVLSVRHCWAPVEWRHSKLSWWWWWWTFCQFWTFFRSQDVTTILARTDRWTDRHEAICNAAS